MRNDLFGVKPRRKKRTLMHVTDAGMFPDGKYCVRFKCKKCGHDTGFVYDTLTTGENKRGIPCPECSTQDTAND